MGTTLKGKWRLERLLGVGGMAAVYAAVHRNQSRAAIKVLHSEYTVDDAICSRFLREGYAANTVAHPGAVTVLDDDVAEDGAAFLVMELLEGETLEARAGRKGGVLPLSEVLTLADQLLDTLAAAHEKGLVHRDLKPENLFLTVTGRLKILDFGIARLRDPLMGKSTTAVGSFMGTPAFMAPEQARGRWEEVDGRSDIWAVGATLFTLLTGRFVHEAETVNDQLILAATTPAPSLRSIAVAEPLPTSVVELVDRGLAYKKEERWYNARTMQAAVHDIIAEVGDGPVPVATPASTPDQSEPVAATLAVAPDTPPARGAVVSDTNTPAAAAISSASRTQSSPAPNRTAFVVAALVALAMVGAVAYAIGEATGPTPPPDGRAAAELDAQGSPEAPSPTQGAAAKGQRDASLALPRPAESPAEKPLAPGKDPLSDDAGAPAPAPPKVGAGASSGRPQVRPKPKPSLPPPPASAPPPDKPNPFDRRF